MSHPLAHANEGNNAKGVSLEGRSAGQDCGQGKKDDNGDITKISFRQLLDVMSTPSCVKVCLWLSGVVDVLGDARRKGLPVSVAKKLDHMAAGIQAWRHSAAWGHPLASHVEVGQARKGSSHPRVDHFWGRQPAH